MKLLKTKTYKIKNLASGLVLGIDGASEDNGALVKLQADGGVDTKYQEWNAVYVDDTWFRLINKQSKKALDLVMGGTMNGTWIHQWEVSDTESQLWCIEDTADGQALLKSKHSTTYLDVIDGIICENAQLQIWEKTNDPVQNWTIEMVKRPVRKKPAAKAAPKAAASKTAASKTSRTAKPARKPKSAVKSKS